MSSFSEYYNKWREETAFLSAGTHDNENYKSLTDPEKIGLYDLVEGVDSILKERDDPVATAIDDYIYKLTGNHVIVSEGYVPLSQYCDIARILTSLILSSEKITSENISQYFKIHLSSKS